MHFQIRPPAPKEADLTTVYDAIIVGSGAAGGMASHVLTSHGLNVLLLEAGRKLDIESELKSMEWPYDHPRRGEMPRDSHAITRNEYTIRQPPYAQGTEYKHVYSYVQGLNWLDYSKNIVMDEQDDRRAEAQQVPQQVLRAGGVRPAGGRLRHPRRVRLADRAHLSGPRHRAPDAAHQLHRPRGDGRSRDRQGAGGGLRRHRDRPALRSAG